MSKVSKIWSDRKGDVAIVFGLMSLALFLMIGGAVDYGRWLHARNQTISAMDAAVLAAGRALQVGGDTNSAIAAAQTFYNQNVEGRLPLKSDTVEFSVSDDGMSVTATGNAYIETPFLSLAHINELPLLDEAGADYSKSEIAIGGNADFNLEISIMLDVTGSMAGSKLTDMKDAAKDLIDIVVWDDQSEHTSKVALVPFSQAVNVGITYFNALTNQTTNSILANVLHPMHPANPTQGQMKQTVFAAIDLLKSLSFVSPAHAGNGNGGDDNDHNSGGGSSLNYSSCVADRTGNAALTDAAPGAGTYLSVFDVVKQSNSWTRDSACKPSNVTIQPLTSDKSALIAKVDSFVASGWTAGHIGTAFAWYTLSPNWSNVWPAASAPAEYNDQSTKKIAILMTDGDYNTWYNGNGNGTSSQQAQSLCASMKNDGISIYAVAFDVEDNSSAATVMSSCASNPGQYYSAEDGDDLKQAFRDIALSISDLYLSH